MNGWDAKDWIVAVLHAISWTSATIYLWCHPSDINFATWCTYSAGVSTAYHWLLIKDSKIQDAPK